MFEGVIQPPPSSSDSPESDSNSSVMPRSDGSSDLDSWVSASCDWVSCDVSGLEMCVAARRVVGGSIVSSDLVEASVMTCVSGII